MDKFSRHTLFWYRASCASTALSKHQDPVWPSLSSHCRQFSRINRATRKLPRGGAGGWHRRRLKEWGVGETGFCAGPLCIVFV